MTTWAQLRSLQVCIATFNAQPVTAFSGGVLRRFPPGDLWMVSAQCDADSLPVAVARHRSTIPRVTRETSPTVAWPDFCDVVVEAPDSLKPVEN